MFENRAAHDAITSANLNINLAEDQLNADLKVTDMTQPSQQVFLSTPESSTGTSGLSLYWRTGKMEHNTYIYRSSFGFSGSPSYFRWPDYHRQAYTQRTLPDYINEESERMPWPPGRGAYVDQLVPVDNGVQLRWPIDTDKLNPTASFNAFFRLALVKDFETAQSLVVSERDPVNLAVDGGVIHGNKDGYNDQEGCYEIRKTGTGPTSIILPADPLKRTIRVKVIGLTGHGAVSTKLDSEPLIPQLSSDGGIADDPLAPIHEQPEAPANAALVTVKLGNKAQTLTVEEVEGIQLVYQTRDPRRNFMVFSTKTGPRWSGVQLSLLDGHARRIRAYGNQEWALTENLMHWFAYMGYTPEQMLDQLRDFQVIKNGPEEIVFKYVSNNTNDGAQSEFLVSMAADAPALQMNIHATFTVLDQWPYKSVQYFDVFPFRGVEPKDWWYDNVLFMDSENKWRTYKTVSQTYDGEQDRNSSGSTFQGLFSSDRGNMLMLTKNFTPNLPTHYIICSNYVDLHSNVLFDDLIIKPSTLDQGYQVSVEYELAIWGDRSLTRDQLIEIGKNSIRAGKLVLPDQKIGSLIPKQ
jgi:hypothetical protein